MPAENNSGRQNLKPNADRTPDELKKMGAKGGKKSGETRKKRKAAKDLARMVLGMSVTTTAKAKRALQKLGYDVEKDGAPSVELLMQIAIANQAMAGDLASARFLYDYAQVPDLRAQLERERVKAQVEARAKVDLSINPAEGDAVLEEVRRRMRDEEGEGKAPIGFKTGDVE